ncbi:MAG: DNA adenine methylase [Victivallaceae bacterium]|nr:DNA adenine methylase [Victivallaceae bacterium]
MNRYLGTKTKILTPLFDTIKKVTGSPNPTVCDIFSGSLAVSLFLKRKGCSVISNDINDLSYVYAKAFLSTNNVPKYSKNLFSLLSNKDKNSLEELADEILDSQQQDFQNKNIYGEFADWNTFKKNLRPTARIIAYLQFFINNIGDAYYDRQDIFDHYTKEGCKSAFTSLRGREGHRNFFSTKNARIIDRTLNHIRYWFQKGMINEVQRCTLVSILLDTMERFVNIQGTYHDFPREGLETRATRDLVFQFPDYFGLIHAKRKHQIGMCEDSLLFIKKANEHDVLYIDPPYNFRQYTAYYFLPNFLAKHATIENMDNYMSKIEFVRGQNMNDDFSSTFCSRDTFIPSLRKLVKQARCRFVILSYFDGVNHWNRFLKENNSEGFAALRAFCSDPDIFEPSDTTVIPVDRINYQSQNGHKAQKIQEYLYVATKKK